MLFFVYFFFFVARGRCDREEHSVVIFALCACVREFGLQLKGQNKKEMWKKKIKNKTSNVTREKNVKKGENKKKKKKKKKKSN